MTIKPSHIAEVEAAIKSAKRGGLAPVTPKPWTAHVDEGKRNLASFAVTAGKRRLAAVWTKVGSHHPTRESVAEGRANALLIAAAPDLLDALRRLVKTVEGSDDDALVEPLFEARRAISRAGSGEPMEGWQNEADEEGVEQ